MNNLQHSSASPGHFKDGAGFPSASKPGLQSRKAGSTKQVTLLVPENPALSAKTPGPSAKTPGRRALGDITNAGQGSKAAKTPKLKADGLKTPARRALANITNQAQVQLQKRAEQSLRETVVEKAGEVEGQVSAAREAASDRERRAVRRTANGRRIVPGVKLRLSTQEKAEIRERATMLAETGIEHVHVTGQQVEELHARQEEKGEWSHTLMQQHACRLKCTCSIPKRSRKLTLNLGPPSLSQQSCR